MKIRYTTTVYNKKFPFGHEVTRTANGVEVEKPSYLGGNYGHETMFVKTDKNIIHIIEKANILAIE